VVAGVVVQVEPVHWVGGPVLEVELRDLSGTIRLVFMGRRQVAAEVLTRI
jgi:hypothetical protein